MTTKRMSKALATIGANNADVVVAFRLRRVDERFEVEWDAANWTDEDVGGSGLPNGVAQSIAQEMLEVAASDAVGRKAGSIGVAFGEAAIKTIAERLDVGEIIESVAGRRS